MITTVYREFHVSAAHRLPHVPAGHKCGRLHGHNYRVRITVAGVVGEASGWIVDFADIDEAFAPLLARLDHQYLNDIIDNPTAELLAAWIWTELEHALPGLSSVEVAENARAGAIVSRPIT